jgi:hypothetical protein
VELDRIADFINKMFLFFNLSTIVVGQILWSQKKPQSGVAFGDIFY